MEQLIKTLNWIASNEEKPFEKEYALKAVEVIEKQQQQLKDYQDKRKLVVKVSVKDTEIFESVVNRLKETMELLEILYEQATFECEDCKHFIKDNDQCGITCDCDGISKFKWQHADRYENLKQDIGE